MLRKATKDDKKVLEGLGEFVESLELDILNEVSKEIFYDILTYTFSIFSEIIAKGLGVLDIRVTKP